jgi:hypothetical protein
MSSIDANQAEKNRPQAVQLIFVWVATLLISPLPNVIWQELIAPPTIWLFWSKMILLVALILLGFAWDVARPLRPYFVVFLVLYGAEELMGRLGRTPLWQGWFGGVGVSFPVGMLGNQLRRLLVALVMIVALFLLKRRRREFFLATGKIDAVAKPVKWLGMDRPVSWARFGWILAGCISLGTLVFLVIAGRPSLRLVGAALPLLPAVLLLATMNAFSEELNYRASLLATLEPVVGGQQSLLLTAVVFGLAHFYGVPYGVIGVIMSGFLGWILGKSMLETRGMFWAWFIHFCQDVLIFSFMAIGSITPGG